MAIIHMNKKPRSDIVAFYIPEDKKDNKITTRIFLKKDSHLYSLLSQAFSANAAEHAFETGDEFLNKFKDDKIREQNKSLAGTVGIKFDFNDMGLVFSTVNPHLDSECQKQIKRYVEEEAAPFSSKRYQPLYTPAATQAFMGMHASMERWYADLKLPSTVPPSEKYKLFQLKTLGHLITDSEEQIQKKIVDLREKYQDTVQPNNDNSAQPKQ